MAHKLTITAKTGPNLQATNLVTSDLTEMHLLLNRKLAQFMTTRGPAEFDLTGITTVTVSISGADYTITIS